MTIYYKLKGFNMNLNLSLEFVSRRQEYTTMKISCLLKYDIRVITVSCKLSLLVNNLS